MLVFYILFYPGVSTTHIQGLWKFQVQIMNSHGSMDEFKGLVLIKTFLWSIYLLTYKVIQLCCPRKLHVIKCFLLNHISFALCLVLMSYTSLELILLAKISRQLFGDVWRSRPFFLWKWCWMLDSHLHRLILYSNTLPSPPLFEWTCMFVFFFVLHSQQMPLNLTGMTEPPFFL